MSQIVLIVRGPQGSGKSTFGEQWLRQGQNRARINRDSIRKSMFDSYVLEPADEKLVTQAEHDMLHRLLTRKKSVLIDNMNLREKNVQAYLKIAAKFNVPVLHKDFDIDLREAKRRNKLRDRQVDEQVIENVYSRYLRNGFPPFPQLKMDGAYVPDLDLPKAILLDVDGTAMNISPERGPFDWAQVLLDTPNEPVVECVKAMQSAGYQVVVMSGRSDVSREDTLLQLEDAGIQVAELWMRTDGDMRGDRVVKRELFDAHIRNQWNIVFALDDRDQVVDMYRQDLQLPVFQVNYGGF